MPGYLALYIVGLIFLAGIIYMLRMIYRSVKGPSADEDPLLNAVESKAAKQNLTGLKAAAVLLYSIIFCSAVWFLYYQDPVPQYSITSIELYDEYRADREQANAKYRNVYIAVTGKYVGKDLAYGSPAVLLETSLPMGRVQCNFEGSRAELVTGLNLGDEVTLLGRVLGQPGNVVIEKCSVF